MEEPTQKNRSKAKEWMVSSQTALGMVTVQLIATGMQLLSKVILNDGTFVFALMTYRHLVAAICVAPFALYYERGVKEKLCWSLLFWLFLNAFIGITGAMGLYYYGLRATTASYAVTFFNLIPIVTFILSLLLRLEKLGLTTRAGKIKILGAILCLGGVLTSGLYKGQSFYIVQRNAHERLLKGEIPHANLVRGSCMLAASSVCYALWFILQVKVLKLLPLKYWATFFTCIMACIQSAVLGLSIDRSKASWQLGLNLQLVTILYSGALATAATFCIICWAVSRRGPAYPAMFNPLALIFVVILEAVILGTSINMGMIIGMILMLGGLYSFLMGKKEEVKKLFATKVKNQEVITVTIHSETSQPTVLQDSQSFSIPR